VLALRKQASEWRKSASAAFRPHPTSGHGRADPARGPSGHRRVEFVARRRVASEGFNRRAIEVYAFSLVD
jgi:hypothetical protein